MALRLTHCFIARIPGRFSSSLASTTAYKDLLEETAVARRLEQISALMHWDSMVTMPQTDEHHQARGEQSEVIAAVIHEKSTSPKIGKLIDEIDPTSLSKTEQSNFALIKKAYRDATMIPAEVEKKKAKVSNDAYVSWTKARAQSDFSIFSPLLEEAFDVAKEVAVLRMDEGESKVYDKMLDDFEKGLPAKRIDEIFAEIEKTLPPLITSVLASSTPPDTAPLHGTFPLSKQEPFNKKIVDRLGFSGRTDVSVHPFTTSFSSSDVRITSRFSETEWYQGLAGSIHETGHALYESNLDTSPHHINSALSMGTHESQSLFWERHVGLSRPFWTFAGPLFRKSFDRDESDDAIFEAVNTVKRSLIRVEADELTYPLHVILRTRIERDVVNGVANVKDIPGLWNEGMKELLDVDVPDDAQGCLQDVHWSGLAIGYFPTYLLGAIAAAQLEHYIRKDLDFDTLVSKGEFGEIASWLKNKVHKHGSVHSSIDVLFQAELGEPLNPVYFLSYLTKKYEKIYKI